MIGRLTVCCALVALLAGCSSSSGPTGAAAGGTKAAGSSLTAPSGTTLSGSTAGKSKAGAVDVCALLSPADAAAVARERGLNGSQTAATKYTLTTKKQTYPGSPVPTSGCSFSIGSDGASGTVVIQVVPGDNISAYASGKKVSGLGDEAYYLTGTTVVRVGDLMLQTSEDSFTNGFVVALYRKMIPKLR